MPSEKKEYYQATCEVPLDKLMRLSFWLSSGSWRSEDQDERDALISWLAALIGEEGDDESPNSDDFYECGVNPATCMDQRGLEEIGL